jgi:tetratricopeptide (TPR) repeat protein
VPKDYAEALRWLRKAAAQGNKPAGQLVAKIERDHPEIVRQMREARAYFEQGLKYGKQNNHEEALKAFRKAASLQPNIATYHRYIGVALASMRRWREAVVAYKRAIQLQPELAATHHNLGAALGNMGQMEEAKKAFEETIRLNPNDIEARKKLAWTQKAISSKGPLKGLYHLDKRRFYPKKHNTEEKKFLFAALKEGEGFEPLPDDPALNAEQKLSHFV